MGSMRTYDPRSFRDAGMNACDGDGRREDHRQRVRCADVGASERANKLFVRKRETLLPTHHDARSKFPHGV